MGPGGRCPAASTERIGREARSGGTLRLPSDMMDDERRQIQAAHTELVEQGVLEPLSTQAADVRIWVDCELASLVENRFAERLDPREMTADLRARWEMRATVEHERLTSPHEYARYAIPYWILEGGVRRGTVALSTSRMGARLVTVSSLYVLPEHRGRGLARRFLVRALHAVDAHGSHGLRIPTYWTWQHAARFYLKLGLWVTNWKHSLVFSSQRRLPDFRIDVNGTCARFGTLGPGGPHHLIEATALGERLAWMESPRMVDLRRDGSEVCSLAVGTFALGLAIHGFPLVRSDAEWQDRHFSADFGGPEGLAYKIEIFEAVDRRDGFQVSTPRIPGLSYRAYDDID